MTFNSDDKEEELEEAAPGLPCGDAPSIVPEKGKIASVEDGDGQELRLKEDLRKIPDESRPGQSQIESERR